MKYRVTVFEKTQIIRQFEVVGFRSAVCSAMKLVVREVEMYVADLEDCELSMNYLTQQEWRCAVTDKDNVEIYGITVERSGRL